MTAAHIYLSNIPLDIVNIIYSYIDEEFISLAKYDRIKYMSDFFEYNALDLDIVNYICARYSFDLCYIAGVAARYGCLYPARMLADRKSEHTNIACWIIYNYAGYAGADNDFAEYIRGFMWLLSNFKYSAEMVMNTAIEYGTLNTIKWCWTTDHIQGIRRRENKLDGMCIVILSKRSTAAKLKIMEWAHENKFTCDSGLELNAAIKHGDIEIVKWLIERKCTLYNTRQVCLDVSRPNALNIIKYLRHNDNISDEIIDLAAFPKSKKNRRGYTKIKHCIPVTKILIIKGLNDDARIKHLHQRRADWDYELSRSAFKNSSLRVIKYLHKYRCIMSPLIYEEALQRGDLNIIKWTQANVRIGIDIVTYYKVKLYKQGIYYSMYKHAKARGDNLYEITRWIIENNLYHLSGEFKDDPCDQFKLFKAVAAVGCINSMKLLHSHGVVFDTTAFIVAAKKGNLCVMKLLHQFQQSYDVKNVAHDERILYGALLYGGFNSVSNLEWLSTIRDLRADYLRLIVNTCHNIYHDPDLSYPYPHIMPDCDDLKSINILDNIQWMIDNKYIRDVDTALQFKIYKIPSFLLTFEALLDDIICDLYDSFTAERDILLSTSKQIMLDRHSTRFDLDDVARDPESDSSEAESDYFDDHDIDEI